MRGDGVIGTRRLPQGLCQRPTLDKSFITSQLPSLRTVKRKKKVEARVTYIDTD